MAIRWGGIGGERLNLALATAIMVTGCQTASPINTAQLKNTTVSTSVFQNVQITGSKTFVVRDSSGNPIGNPMVVAGGTSMRALGGAFNLTADQLTYAKNNADGFFHVYADGFVPAQVWIGDTDPITLPPMTSLVTVPAVAPGGSLDTKKGIVAQFSAGALSVATNVAMSLYTPVTAANAPTSTTTPAVDPAAARSAFLAAVAATPASASSYKVQSTASGPGSGSSAATCDAAEAPLPCAATTSLGVSLSVDGPLQTGSVLVTYDFGAMAASGDANLVAASHRLQQTVNQINASATKQSMLNLFQTRYGIYITDDSVAFNVPVGSSTSNDQIVRSQQDGMSLLGVNLEVTIVSGVSGGLPSGATVPALQQLTTPTHATTGSTTAGQPVVGNDGSGLLSGASSLISQVTGLVTGLISQDGNGLISQDGNGLISQDGNGLIGQDGNGLISQDGNGLISQDGNGLIGQDGNGLVNNAGGSISGVVTSPFSPPEGGKYRVSDFEDQAAPDARVYASSQGGLKLWTTADSSGSYTCSNVGSSLPYVFVVATSGPARLSGLAAAPHAGKVEANIDAASTAVAEWVLSRMSSGAQKITAFSPAGYATDVENMRENMTTAQAQAITTEPNAAGLAIAENVFTTNGFIFESMGALPTVVAAPPASGPVVPTGFVPTAPASVPALPKPSLPSTRGLGPVQVNSDTLNFSVYDDVFQDGDRCRISLDGVVIPGMTDVYEYIAGRGYSLTLHPGTNVLTFYATSIGFNIPGFAVNTMEVAIDPSNLTGGNRVQLSHDLSLHQTETITITAP